MREYKFRGKRLTAHEIHHMYQSDDPLWAYGSLVVDIDGRHFILNDHGGFRTMDEVDPETVGQYSNYYDVKFYDGDIISVDCDCDSEYGCNHFAGRYLVVWNEETAGYALKNLNNRIFYALDNFGEENMHNIGNRWDNPEFLED